YPFLVLLICISACRKDNKFTPLSISPGARTYSSNQIRNYFGLMCTITKSTAGFFPTQAARAYGYLGITAYESVRNGIPGASSLYGQINGLTAIPSINSGMEYNWAISSNAALAQMMRDMFGASLSATLTNKVDSTETANLATLSTGVSQDIVTRSIQYGKDVTAAVYTASMTDGGDKSYLNPFSLPYTVPVCPSCWVPTNPAVPNPLSPNWANNRPFILADVSSVTPAPPTDFSTDPSSAFYANAMAVYNQVKNNTADQVEISKYWSDDPFNTCTPAGHTFNIMIQLLKENSATLEKASVAFAKLSIAENDAFISCWKGKYQYNRIRPVSYIKKNIDATFATIIGTPPFPAYCGGHSFESGAGSMIFINMFTDGSGNYNYTDYSQVQYGFAPRQYTNFTAMALECSNSRYYAGIHFNEDNLAGLKGGQMVGGNVNTLIKWPSSLK
ncbi:MAG: vanadium-dependent haloperoxidase, partial [Mucilaginibacter sp.]